MGSRIAVLKDGILQQVNTPQVLYDKPDNVFVAGFIGSPSMNFFDATMIQENGGAYADTGAFRVRAPESKRDAWMQTAGRRVILGVRPEDIHDPNYAPPGIRPLEVEALVDVRELMGNEVFLYLKSGNHDYIARVDPRTAAYVGNRIEVVFNAENMHLFDAETEQALR